MADPAQIEAEQARLARLATQQYRESVLRQVLSTFQPTPEMLTLTYPQLLDRLQQAIQAELTSLAEKGAV